MKSKYALLIFTLSSVPAFAGTYDFHKLHADLGYTDDYFGASDDELSSLNSYINKGDTFFSEINGYLRFYPKPYEWYGTNPKQAKVEVARIDRIFSRAPTLPQDLILFRGLTLEFHGNQPFEIGEEFGDKAFVSTTTSQKVAFQFAGGVSSPQESKAAEKALLTLYFSRREPRGLLVDQGENEVILPHGERFKVMDRRSLGDHLVSYLVQVCDGACKADADPAAREFWQTQGPSSSGQL